MQHRRLKERPRPGSRLLRAALNALAAFATAASAVAQIHVALVLDASGWMYNRLADGRYRIDAAKAILQGIVAALPGRRPLRPNPRSFHPGGPMPRTARTLVAAAFAVLLAHTIAMAHAQEVGPVGPGPATIGDATVAGQFLDWDRPGTPTLVLHGFGRGMRLFADIAEDGAFAIALPAIDDATPLGSVPCNPPGGSPVGQFTEVTLLTPLEGFTTPSEADRGLSTIGMAVLADAAFAADIGAPGTRRVVWIASRVAQTFEPGSCNNVEPFDVVAGWTPITITYGPSGGPHHLRPGVPDDVGWYWWAFLEPDAP